MCRCKIATIYFLPCILLIFINCYAQNNSATNRKGNNMNEKKKVTGIGGIFFKANDPEKIKEWYSKNLGMATNEYGALFEFRLSDAPEKKGHLQWSAFDKNTEYFKPSEKEFMINYRVENLEALVDELKKNGVTIVDSIETYDYGKFIHILDPENNKIELWEPVDSPFDKEHEEKGAK
jgi:predicted enzyme related to lactoylglutathione lyase